MKPLLGWATKTSYLLALLLTGLAVAAAVGCGSSSSSGDDDSSPFVDDDASPTDDDASPADDDASPEGYWTPSTVVPISVHANVRGNKVERGIIHCHSVYSHDACDNNPMPGGEPNAPCLEQFRTAMCTTDQQFIMLTDHATYFGDYDFPAVLLYNESAGDELVYENSAPVANIISCPDGNKTILMAGSENNLMPIHLLREPDGGPEQRIATLGGQDEAAVQTFKSLGAEVIVNHSEEWTTDALAALSIDGIELYNLHANLGTDTTHIIATVLKILPYILPLSSAGHPDLAFLAFFEPNTTDLHHIDRLLALRHQVGVMATDVHRNSIPIPFSDGDRGDSYRRLMRWFANYILVDQHDVANVVDALAKGRFYGAFQVFGEPVGFDFYADTAKADFEMGDEVSLADHPTLHVSMPTFYNMDPSLPEPTFSAVIYRASQNGGVSVASSTGEPIEFAPVQTGAYRVEVHVVPNHLRKWLGGHPDDYIHDYPLVYSNAIYVTP